MDCDLCHYLIEYCNQFNKNPYPNRPRCRGPSDRHKVLTSNAAQILKPFSFLRGVSCVTYDGVVPDNADELSDAIKDPQKEVDLFPLYWATLCWIQRVPKDDYTQKIGRMWLDSEGNLWDDPVDQGGAEPDQYESCMGPATAYWSCPEWLPGKGKDAQTLHESGRRDQISSEEKRDTLPHQLGSQRLAGSCAVYVRGFASTAPGRGR